ncbi:MAG: hypothetical protein KF812_07380 [Fimbriimonadaceae bacterium]|nr:hypothetical protein [Fimbriimonadaceae bacterium]
MKKELPGWAVPVLVVVGIAILAGVWFFSGGRGGLTPQEQEMAEKQTEIQKQLGESYGQGQGAPGGEAAARAQYEAQQQAGGQ